MILLEKMAARTTETTIMIAGRAWKMGEWPQAKSPFARYQARAAHSSGMENASQALDCDLFDSLKVIYLYQAGTAQLNTITPSVRIE